MKGGSVAAIPGLPRAAHRGSNALVCARSGDVLARPAGPRASISAAFDTGALDWTLVPSSGLRGSGAHRQECPASLAGQTLRITGICSGGVLLSVGSRSIRRN